MNQCFTEVSVIIEGSMSHDATTSAKKTKQKRKQKTILRRKLASQIHTIKLRCFAFKGVKNLSCYPAY